MNDTKFLSEKLLLKVNFHISGKEGEVRYKSVSARKNPSIPKLMWAIANNIEEKVSICDIVIEDVEIFNFDNICIEEELKEIIYLSDDEPFDHYRFFIVFYKSEYIDRKFAEGWINLITIENKFPSLKMIKESIIKTNKSGLEFKSPLIKNILELSAKDYFDFLSNE